ncbi:anti-sigma factor antagonist [Alishewanella longhuensis]|uniref:Anti-sigma factor antagonist n=1 Tax=Alishewanella longhuensis TaxID=1091037 RepID=A0ABQ3KVJ3_9ALTE|nr:STAS domain-containing protein [Alishewanella longhuensis]GHG63414.1 anti-sigma factor antagonist [Alishewanella longhuensis]
MSYFCHFNAEQGCLRVQGELTIYQASATLQAFRAACASMQLTQLDLSQVTDFDSAGLQLLLALKKSAPEVQLRHHSDAVIKVLSLTNLMTELDLDPLSGGV